MEQEVGSDEPAAQREPSAASRTPHEPPATGGGSRAGGGAQGEGSGELKRAALWTTAGYGGAQLLRFVGNIILWRLLFPEAFGVMALVNSVLQALRMFSDVGIGPSIIQNRAGEDGAFLDTAWTISVLRGAAIWLTSLVLAAPMAEFYEQPELVQIIPIVGLSALLQGFQSTRVYGAQRDLSLGKLTIIELSSAGCGMVAMVSWALIWPSVWALVIGSIVQWFCQTILSHTVLPGHRNRLKWDKEAARELTRFGRWIFVSTLLTFVALQSDRLIFGKLVPIAVLGVYSIAQTYATLPAFLLGNLIGRAVFPHLSKEVNRDGDLLGVYLRVRVPVLLAAGWLFTCLLAGGPVLIAVFYGPDASDAGWILQVLCVGTWFTALKAIANAPVLAAGHPKWLAAANAAKVAGMVALIPVGYHLGGFPGAVWGFALSEGLNYLVLLIGTVRLKLPAWKQDLGASVVMTALAGAFYMLSQVLQGTGMPLLAVGIILAILITGVWGAAFVLYRRRRARRGLVNAGG